LQKTPYFTSNLLTLNRAVQRDYAPLDSFVAYMCVEGACAVKALDVESDDSAVMLRVGEAVLIPAILNDIIIEPQGQCQLLEIYMEI
jgi:mannose-6-phosphate isomerase